MSKCISSEGEYSDHELAEQPRFMCARCFVFDEDAALAALDVAEATLERVRALHHKITRYGNDMYSISAESYEEEPSSYEDMEPFDLCAECYEIEKLICEECGGDAAIGHRSNWPCPTVAALAPVTEEGDKDGRQDAAHQE